MIKSRFNTKKDNKLIEFYNKLSTNKAFKYLRFLPVLILLIMFTKKWFVFGAFTIITYIIVYYTKLWHVPIDVSPLFFLGVVVTRYYGFGNMLIFYGIAYFIPKTLAGHSASWISYIFVSISWLSFLTVYIFPASMPLQLLGYITSIIQFILSAMFQSTMKPLMISLADGVGNVMNNLIWFLIFSDAVVWIMSTVI
jgi:hypothetical protein